MSNERARRSPDPAAVGFPLVSRRSFLLGAGAVALGGPTLLAACGSSKKSESGSATTAGGATTSAGTATTAGGTATTAAGGGNLGTVSVGSNYSDKVPKTAFQSVMDGWKDGSTKVNTVDHNTFQEQINQYLQGQPDDVFTWFAGYRMQFFADKGLLGDISDVWGKVGGDFSDALKKASTGPDGKQYFVPFYYYPWAVFYRKSVFQDKGYTPPKTWDDFIALAKKMKTDGLVPVAFADKDGWPAMGTFDYLNMRINGYDFHINLMAGKEAWDGPEVKKVFDQWTQLLEYSQPGSLGRTWQEAAQSLVKKESGMYVLGAFVGEQFPEGADRDDLDFFAFPEIDSKYGQDAVEAPIDGFLMAAKPKNEKGAKGLLEYLSTPAAEAIYLKGAPNNVSVNKRFDTSTYTPLQKKSAEIVASAKSISQFMDRDTRPDFASTVMIPSLQKFIDNPSGVDGLLKSIEAQKKTIFTS